MLLNFHKARDIPALDKLLFEVHKVHSDARPDIFKEGAKKFYKNTRGAVSY